MQVKTQEALKPALKKGFFNKFKDILDGKMIQKLDGIGQDVAKVQETDLSVDENEEQPNQKQDDPVK